MQREAVVQAGWYLPVPTNETLDHILQKRDALEFELARELKLACERQHHKTI